MSKVSDLTASTESSKEAMDGCARAEKATHPESCGGAPYRPAVKKRVGFLTPWNERCGLSTYAEYMAAELPAGSFVVYTVAGAANTTRADESFVRRIWRQGSADFGALFEAIRQDDIGLLHINGIAESFPAPHFAQFVERLRAAGIKVVVELHTVYTADDCTAQLARSVDAVIVHSAESRLEAIANGARPENVFVVPLGIRPQPAPTDAERRTLREKCGVTADTVIVAAFGFLHPHKGMEGVVEGVERLKKLGIKAHGFIIGSIPESSAEGARYVAYLKGAAKHAGIADAITIIDRFVPAEELQTYLRAADVVLMNYRCNHFEASGACAEAIGAGAIVAASIAPQFMGLGDAVWHITSGYGADLSVELLVTRPELRAEIERSAARYAAEHAWPRTVERLCEIYQRQNFIPTVVEEKEKAVAHNDSGAGQQRKLKVLMQNRPNTLTQRGGDTVLIERLKAGLEARGVDVTLDLSGSADPKSFDIVHLFNFVLPEMTRAFAERAHRAGTPFVVTTLNEDVPTFHNQSIAVADALIEYVKRGQERSWWTTFRPDVRKVQPSGFCDNSWTARHAAKLFTNGSRESAVIRRMYPDCAPIAEVRLGHEVADAADPNLFIREYGVKDFILCVGRLESRKNQLMLLKALEDSEIPVVLAAGGFTYQPEYDRAVRCFQRKGKTVVLDRLSPEMLASAYAAARVHILPSWYELPGLVSLEAAQHNCNVVVTDCGTAWDYFGDEAFYCEPSDERSIANAVMAAFYSPIRPGLRDAAKRAQWGEMAAETLRQYETITAVTTNNQTNETARFAMESSKNVFTTVAPSGTGEPQGSVMPNAAAHMEGRMTTNAQIEIPVEVGSTETRDISALSFDELLEHGERAARSYEYHRAHEFLSEAERVNPTSVRSMRARGAVFLAEGNIAEAQRYFDRAIALDSNDPKTLSGLGMCAMQSKAPETAYQHLVKALDIAPDQLVAMLQLIECSYALDRYNDLETALRRYMARHPEDIDMRYCLAGCLFKMNRLDEAQTLADAVLRSKADHAGAQQLVDMIAKTRAAKPLTAQIETEITGPSRVSRPGTGESGVEQCADAALGQIDELKQRGDYAAMKKSCIELLARNGLSPEQIERGTVMQAESEILTGDLVSGQKLYDIVLTRNPASARALSGKGALAAHEGDWVGAREYFERALKGTPNFDVALAGMGMCFAQSGDSERAWECYLRASKSNPENTRALLGLIEIGYPKKRYAEIEAALKTYLEFHSADLDFVYSLAGCLYVQGKHTEALEAVARIELFEPTNQRARELRQTIEGMGVGSAGVASPVSR